MMLVTAYNSTTDQCGNSNGITSSGTLATEGRTVASDDLAIGTRVTIGGHEYTVEDTFGGNYRNRIDIYMGSSETDVSRAMQFGRQWITVEIKEEQ
jgi:3D (Asp-Asp-Asp) domain-containing protein